MRRVRSAARGGFVVAVAVVVLGCSGQSDSVASTTAATTTSIPALLHPESTADRSDDPTTSRAVRFGEDWPAGELTTPAADVRRGDSVDVVIECPERDRAFAAPFEVVHPDLTFARAEVTATASDIYATSFVVPYWLPPGELELRGACPRPPGPCDDTGDCAAYLSVPSPVVTVRLTAETGVPWDAWRPVTGPFLAEPAEVGATPAGGAPTSEYGPESAVVDARVGDRLRVAARCQSGAATDGARFVLMSPRLVVDTESDGWGWSVSEDPDRPGRFVVSSERLLVSEAAFGEPLPWFVEVAAQPAGEPETIVADLTVDAGLLDPVGGPTTSLFVAALCEDVGMPFDPRSIDVETASIPLLISLSE